MEYSHENIMMVIEYEIGNPLTNQFCDKMSLTFPSNSVLPSRLNTSFKYPNSNMFLLLLYFANRHIPPSHNDLPCCLYQELKSSRAGDQCYELTLLLFYVMALYPQFLLHFMVTIVWPLLPPRSLRLTKHFCVTLVTLLRCKQHWSVKWIGKFVFRAVDAAVTCSTDCVSGTFRRPFCAAEPKVTRH